MFDEIKDMLYQVCKVSRTTETLSKPHNRPIKSTVSNTYNCLIARKSPGYVQQSNSTASFSTQLRVYMNIEADIKKGDLLECDGSKYRVGLVYKPMNDHIEADLTIVGDEL